MYKDLLYSQFAVNYLVIVLTIYTCDINQFGCRIGGSPITFGPRCTCETAVVLSLLSSTYSSAFQIEVHASNQQQQYSPVRNHES
jgi:hypothetical protein